MSKKNTAPCLFSRASGKSRLVRWLEKAGVHAGRAEDFTDKFAGDRSVENVVATKGNFGQAKVGFFFAPLAGGEPRFSR